MPTTDTPACTLYDWRSLRTELLFMFDSPIPAETVSISGRRDGDFSAWLVKRGWAEVRVGREVVRAHAGQWLICFAQELAQRFSADCHLLSMRILQVWPDGLGLWTGPGLHVLDAAEHPRLETLVRQIQKIVGPHRWKTHQGLDPRHEFLSTTRLSYRQYVRYGFLLQQWIAVLVDSLMDKGLVMQSPHPVDPRVLRAVHVLDALPPWAEFPQRRLESVSGLTIGRLNRLFVAAYGHTTHAYWENRRFERARLSLTLPQVRVKEVAAQFGFLQLSHFSAWFKRQAGISPRQYRQQAMRNV